MRGRARDGVGLLVKVEQERFVMEWREVYCRLMWVRMTLGVKDGCLLQHMVWEVKKGRMSRMNSGRS